MSLGSFFKLESGIFLTYCIKTKPEVFKAVNRILYSTGKTINKLLLMKTALTEVNIMTTFTLLAYLGIMKVGE